MVKRVWEKPKARRKRFKEAREQAARLARLGANRDRELRLIAQRAEKAKIAAETAARKETYGTW